MRTDSDLKRAGRLAGPPAKPNPHLKEFLAAEQFVSGFLAAKYMCATIRLSGTNMVVKIHHGSPGPSEKGTHITNETTGHYDFAEKDKAALQSFCETLTRGR